MPDKLKVLLFGAFLVLSHCALAQTAVRPRRTGQPCRRAATPTDRLVLAKQFVKAAYPQLQGRRLFLVFTTADSHFEYPEVPPEFGLTVEEYCPSHEVPPGQPYPSGNDVPCSVHDPKHKPMLHASFWFRGRGQSLGLYTADGDFTNEKKLSDIGPALDALPQRTEVAV